MNICIIGTGYVGLITGTCFAETGNDVVCVDINKEKIEKLKQGKCPIYEPGLEMMMQRNIREGRLEFSTDISYGVRKSLLNFIAVGTPAGEDGSADLNHVLSVAKTIGKVMDSYKIIIDKSTVPVGTADMVKKTIGAETTQKFDVASNPEFLKEGDALTDFMKPDRIIIGADDPKVAEILKELYSPFIRTGNPVIIMDVKSAEMTKYASNAMLATRISFMNELSRLCERTGADIESVRKGMSSDSRIGHSFLFAGAGYGGSCFPKDVKAIIRTGRANGVDMSILEAVEKVNEEQKKLLGHKVSNYFSDEATKDSGKKILDNKKIAIWGLSFKPQTDDMREAPSIFVINHLLEHGAKIKAYDPAAIKTAKNIFGDSIEYGNHSYDCLKDADCLIIITEWNEFRRPNYEKMKELMKAPRIFDGRNLYEHDTMREYGFEYFSIGRKNNP